MKPKAMNYTKEQYSDKINSMRVDAEAKKVMLRQLDLNDRGLIFLLNAKMK